MPLIFAPVLYTLGGIVLRATTAAMARRVAAAGGKKLAGKTAKKIINATKANIDKAVKAAKEAAKRTKVDKTNTPPKVDKVTTTNLKDVFKRASNNKTKKTKVTSEAKNTTKNPPPKTTTKQDPKGNAKPTVDKTTKNSNKRQKTVNTANKLNAPKQVQKPSNLPRNAVILASIGGGGFLLDKLSKLHVEKKRDETYKRAENLNKKPVVEPTFSNSFLNKIAAPKKSETKTEPKNVKTTFSSGFLNKIAAPKPKSNLSRFGKAFKNARKQGRYSFMFDGREITTRFKEETVAEHKKKFGKK